MNSVYYFSMYRVTVCMLLLKDKVTVYFVCVSTLVSPDAHHYLLEGEIQIWKLNYILNWWVGKDKTQLSMNTLQVNVVCEVEATALIPSIPSPVELCICILEIFAWETCIKFVAV